MLALALVGTRVRTQERDLRAESVQSLECLGHGGVVRIFHMLREAAKEFDRWVYANGKKLSGLVSRRAEEKALFLKKN